MLPRVAVCCSVLQCAAACCSVLPRVAVCCSVLQCAAACCSVFCRLLSTTCYCMHHRMSCKHLQESCPPFASARLPSFCKCVLPFICECLHDILYTVYSIDDRGTRKRAALLLRKQSCHPFANMCCLSFANVCITFCIQCTR